MHVHHASEGDIPIRKSLRDVAVTIRDPDPGPDPCTHVYTHAHTVPQRHVVWSITCALSFAEVARTSEIWVEQHRRAMRPRAFPMGNQGSVGAEEYTEEKGPPPEPNP